MYFVMYLVHLLVDIKTICQIKLSYKPTDAHCQQCETICQSLRKNLEGQKMMECNYHGRKSSFRVEFSMSLAPITN